MRSTALRAAALSVMCGLALGWMSEVRSAPAELTPLQVAAGSELDVAYGPDERQRLDIHWPAGEGPFPAVIYLHPGGWAQGDKSLSMPLWDWTERGYVVVAVNYRYAKPPHSIADAADDASIAISMVADRADDWSIDADRIGVFGFSAGGHLAAMAASNGAPVAAMAVAAAPTDLRPFLSPDAGPFNLREGEAMVDFVEGVLGCSTDCPLAAKAASPAAMPAGSVPLLIVHGSDDPIVPPSQARALFDHLDESGTDVGLRIVAGGGHDPHVSEAGIDEFFDLRLRP